MYYTCRFGTSLARAKVDQSCANVNNWAIEMMQTRSAVYKMIKDTAPEERQITRWQPPFSSDATPYTERDFDIRVRKLCAAQRPLMIPKICKAIVLGDVAVGKTSLVNRFCHKLFDNNYKATIGVDFEVERFDILGVPYNLQIWDTAGQERFKCIAASYYRSANTNALEEVDFNHYFLQCSETRISWVEVLAVIVAKIVKNQHPIRISWMDLVIVVVFDLGSLMSLSHCRQWLDEAQRCNDGSSHVFLVGTKRDLLSNPVYEVIERRAFAVASTMKAEFWAVSSRTGDGISQLFSRIAGLSFNASLLHELHSVPTICTVGSDVFTLKSKPENSAEKPMKSRCSNSCMMK